MTKKKKTKAANDNGLPASSPVGYCSPPKHSQFPKGKSGNLTGRPKAKPNLESEVKAVFDKKLTTTVNGKPVKMGMIQVMITKLVTIAVSGEGNIAALKQAIDLIKLVYPPVNDNQTSDTGSSFQLTPEDLAIIEKSTLLKGIK